MMNPTGVSLFRPNQQDPTSTLSKSEKFIRSKELAENQEQSAPATAKNTTEGTAAEFSEDLSAIWEKALKAFEDHVFMSQVPLCVPSI
ncbi:uncharacterized protein BHQ10_009072 [Talaromyces amestolkiae]|uniref:Uncharacterized protein n=1 Tax=Talaromyces amestolkiae TaxID=1196081 RepID=A0A364LB57_TALAM|nr:uncharacterized protein BHQ10_009072 [Talaromyces amestolkiae]RAO73060.1 hypothetical protein BHQ10_009072 [Talaromyces amestolkiae]